MFPLHYYNVQFIFNACCIKNISFFRYKKRTLLPTWYSNWKTD